MFSMLCTENNLRSLYKIASVAAEKCRNASVSPSVSPVAATGATAD